jgi:predicted lipoprotein with Yx(FWY)xxD motif
MRTTMLTLICSAIAIAGCGDSDDGSAGATTPPASAPAAATMEAAPAAQRTTTAAPAAAPTGKAITTGRSQFGTILFDTRKQAIYIFENDAKNKSNCYGQCAKDWPPVYTKGKPRARGAVKQSLLGTTKRRDGRLQVTYRGQPLYYYVDEGPGEVKCHNVFLNGGLWWVLGADGKRKA